MKKKVLFFSIGVLTGAAITFIAFVVIRMNSKYVMHRPIFKTPQLSLRIYCQSDFDTIQVINSKGEIVNVFTNLKGLDQFIVSYDKSDKYLPYRITTHKASKIHTLDNVFDEDLVQSVVLYKDSIVFDERR